MNYYVCALINVLQGYNLDAHDKFSFDHHAYPEYERRLAHALRKNMVGR